MDHMVTNRSQTVVPRLYSKYIYYTNFYMSELNLNIAFWNYDRTRPLGDGTVKIDGVNATFYSARIVTEIFERMIRAASSTFRS